MARKNKPAVAVLGAGSWGTALAIVLARNGHAAWLWGRGASFVAELEQSRCNNRFLPNAVFPPSLHVSDDLDDALEQCSDCLIAVPSHAFEEIIQRIRTGDATRHGVAWATKGVQPGSGALLHKVAARWLGEDRPVAVISGPTFAREVVRGMPTAVTVAARSAEYASHWSARLHNDTLRVYTSDDLVGVSLGGALKNVLAIAAGISDGLGLGANTRAALISRGLAEMMRLGVALGGQRETFMGLTGLGDLVLTSTDDLSRNRRLGLALARGETLRAAMASIGQVVEGVPTALELLRLAQEAGVEMPITEQVYHVLYSGRPAHDAVQALLNRERRAEAV